MHADVDFSYTRTFRRRSGQHRLPPKVDLPARRSFYMQTTVLKTRLLESCDADVNWDPAIGQMALHKALVEKGSRIDWESDIAQALFELQVRRLAELVWSCASLLALLASSASFGTFASQCFLQPGLAAVWAICILSIACLFAALMP